MFFYSLSERCGRILPALFTTAILAVAVFAQDKTPVEAPQPETFGTHYDQGGYINSLKNRKIRPGAARTSGTTLGQIDPAFNPTLDFVPGQSRAIAIQPDGKILLGGFFRSLGGTRYDSLVRLNADYSVDNAFHASINGTVNSIALAADGKIVIGGIFTAVNGTGANFIARLNPDGSTDTSFNTAGGASDMVNDVAIQADGKIVIGGIFLGVGGESKPYAARLNADGSVDTTFTPSFSLPAPPFFMPGVVYTLAVQPDGKILLGGLFVTATFPTPTTTPIVRLNADGSPDTSFNPGTIPSNLLRLALQPDGKIVIGGFFANVNGTPRNRIARLNANGSLDTSFDPGTGANVNVNALHIRPDGKILAGGIFTTFNDQPRMGVVQLNSNGTLDDTFIPNTSILGPVYSITVAANGNVLAAGSIRIGPGTRDTFAIFNSAGVLDTAHNFNSTGKGGTRAIVVQPDGKILAAGIFTRANGAGRNRIARFNPDGSLDTTFNSTSLGGSPITAIFRQPDGKILAGANTLIRLNPDGVVDTAFTQSSSVPSRVIKSIAMQPDGKILVSYTSAVLGQPGAGGISRLNPDGSLDGTFSGLPLPMDAIVVQPDGSILAGGATSIGYVSSQTGQSEMHYGIFKMNADGSHDRTFRSGFVSNEGGAGYTAVYALERQADGRILVGGTLYTGSSSSPVAVARLNATGTIDGTFHLNTTSSAYEFPRAEDIQILPGGKIMVAGLFDHVGLLAQKNVVRVNADGSVDSSFAANTDGTIFDLAVDANGKVLIGGDFDTANGAPRTGLARLLGETVPRRTVFDFDGDGKSDISVFRPAEGNWYLLQSTAGYTGTHFGIPTDKLVPADYDADGKTDVAVFRDGAWYIMGSQVGFQAYTFGQTGDIPQPADFNGDGKSELCVFRPADGGWYKLDLNGNVFTGVTFGQNGDKPVVGDYDGDGKADPAVFRGGAWYILGSTQGYYGVNFGIATDKVVPADYDGDGKTDQAVVRDGFWYLLESTAGYTGFQWGLATDVPVAADYDGDGKADVSVYRDGQWYMLQTSAGYSGANFGLSTDKPVPNSFVQ